MKPFIHRFFTVLLILIITVTIIIYYAVKIEPYTVTINNVNLNNNFPENLKIIQISDIQISENYQASDFQTIISPYLPEIYTRITPPMALKKS